MALVFPQYFGHLLPPVQRPREVSVSEEKKPETKLVKGDLFVPLSFSLFLAGNPPFFFASFHGMGKFIWFDHSNGSNGKELKLGKQSLKLWRYEAGWFSDKMRQPTSQPSPSRSPTLVPALPSSFGVEGVAVATQNITGFKWKHMTYHQIAGLLCRKWSRQWNIPKFDCPLKISKVCFLQVFHTFPGQVCRLRSAQHLFGDPPVMLSKFHDRHSRNKINTKKNMTWNL